MLLIFSVPGSMCKCFIHNSGMQVKKVEKHYVGNPKKMGKVGPDVSRKYQHTAIFIIGSAPNITIHDVGIRKEDKWTHYMTIPSCMPHWRQISLYTDLKNVKSLEKYIHGTIKDPVESLIYCNWDHISKIVFVRLNTFTIGVLDAMV